MADYSKKLEALDAEVIQTLSSIPESSRVLVTNHAVFAYFAESYDFKILGTIIPSASTLSNASAKDLVDLAEEMKAEGVLAVFVDSSSSDALAEALAGELEAVQVVTLFSESLGPFSIFVTKYRKGLWRPVGRRQQPIVIFGIMRAMVRARNVSGSRARGLGVALLKLLVNKAASQ